jgi:hypothetical protein
MLMLQIVYIQASFMLFGDLRVDPTTTAALIMLSKPLTMAGTSSIEVMVELGLG